MEYRQLGKTDLSVSPIAFGGNVFGWTIDEKTSFDLLDTFVDKGFNLIDTADVYSRWKPGNTGGESETIIGNWMKSRNNRSKVVIATKVGADMGLGKKDLTKAYILKAVEDSLRRLQTDYIDLYQTHWDDDTTPVEETLEAYGQLVADGKVKWIGASNLTPARLKASLEASNTFQLPIYQTFQPGYNLYDRADFEKELQQICVDNNIGVISYYSLASGFLTGKYRSEADLGKSVRGGGVSKYLTQKGFSILHALDEVAAKYSLTPASVSLAWLMSRPAVVAPIASATKIAQLDDFVTAADLKLETTDIQLLDQASAW